MLKIALSIAGHTCEAVEGWESLAALSQSDISAGEEGRKERVLDGESP